MRNIDLRRFGLLCIAAIALVAVGCTRRASTAPEATSPGELSPEEQSQQATMEAVREAILTQTHEPEIQLPTATFTPGPPTATATPAEPSPTPVEIVDTPTPGGGNQTYIVQPGEWVYSIARKFGVDPEAIISANNLQPPFNLEVGQELIIPATGSESPASIPVSGEGTYTVAAGDSVYSIASQYGVDPDAIIELNGLVYPYTLYPGDVLQIP